MKMTSQLQAVTDQTHTTDELSDDQLDVVAGGRVGSAPVASLLDDAGRLRRQPRSRGVRLCVGYSDN